MKTLLRTIAILLLLASAHSLHAQNFPEREANTFAHFDADATGSSKINAYLLSYLARIVYQDPLGLDLGDMSRVSTNSLWEAEFVDRTQHFFYDPTPPEPPRFTSSRPNPPCTRQGCACSSYEIAKTPAQQAASRLRKSGIASAIQKSSGPSVGEPVVETRTAKNGIVMRRHTLRKVPSIQKVSPAVDVQLTPTKGKVSACESQRRTYARGLMRYKAAYKSYERAYDRYLAELEQWEASRPQFEFFDNTDGQGYDPEVMLITSPDYLLVVFRGTDNVEGAVDYFGYDNGEWIGTNFEFGKVRPGNGLDGEVHRGFWTSLGFIRSELANAIVESGGEDKPVWITGHSLGGAHAQLFAAYLNQVHDIRAQGVYVYGSPHVGDGAFVAQLNAMFPGHRLQRFEFQDDPATNVPLRSLFYDRAGTRNFYSREVGNSNYFFNKDERALLPLPLDACKHHTEWYARAAYFELSTSQRSRVPEPPSRPTSSFFACSATDVSEAVSRDIGN